MGWRLRVSGCADIVHAVAVDAGRHTFIARGQPLAVNTGLILCELIDTLLGSELVYQVCVAVTAGAQLGDCGPWNLADKSAGRAHGDCEVVRAWITPVTIVTAKSMTGVDVAAEGFGWRLKIALENGVALEATVLGRHRQANHEKAGQ